MLAIEKEEGGRINLLKSLLVAARLSVGSHEYRQLFIYRAGGYSEDVTRDGELSCAYSTSAIFHRFGLLTSPHTTVAGLEEEIVRSSDWISVNEPIPGSIGILEPKRHLDGKSKNRHTFICINSERAVHNDARCGSPQIAFIDDFAHHTGEPRLIVANYIHRQLLLGRD